MTRSVPVAVLLVVLAAGGVAHAQGMLPNNASIVFEHRKIYDDSKKDGSFIEPDANSTTLLHYFNLAHCNCAQANMGTTGPGTFQYLVRETAQSSQHVPVDFWVGTTCDMATSRTGTSPTCTPLTSESVNDLDADLFPGGVFKNFDLFQVATANSPAQPPTACPQLDSVSNSIFALVAVSPNSGTNYNVSFPQPAGGLTGDTTSGGIDTRPPPLPAAGTIKAVGGDSAIHITWSAPTSNNTDIAYYQALCSNVDGTPALSKASDGAQYVTTRSLCNAAGDPELMATSLPAAPGEMPVSLGDLNADFANLDPRYICGPTATGTATALDLGGLTNETPYQVILLSIDRHGNYTGTYFTSTISPIPSTDFWEDLHDRGGHAEGGLCLLAETYGNDSALTGALRAFRDDTLGASRAGRWLSRAYYATLAGLGAVVHRSIALRVLAAVALAPAVALALLWHWLTLPGVLGLIAAAVIWRRWRKAVARRSIRLPRPRAVAPIAVLSIALVAGRAHAGGYQPYWEDSDSLDKKPFTATDDVSGDVTWHVGVRIGPYVPDIDGQLGGSKPGPYEQMFGGYHILTMLDVDRIVWSGFGQVGIGLSLGYWQKTASTFTIDSMPSDNPRPRASDHNTFRLVPTELSATYRFTWFDDNYGVPIVPYARGGLGYYIWWVSVAGHYAHACGSGGTSPFCTDGQSRNDKALGASLGLQGAIGLAIRAERIDASAAMSMQQSGIQHAGIYAELSLAKIDGFGSDTKLSVGDRTWFAGVDFEF
jgi:hypothetical protein